LETLKSLTQISLQQCDDASSFLQSGFWGAFKACFAYTSYAFRADLDRYGEKTILVLCRALVPGVDFAYCPWSPELPEHVSDDNERVQLLTEIAMGLKKVLPKSVAFIRFDPPGYSSGKDSPPPVIGKPFVHASADIQPPDTVLLDISKNENEILEQMHSKCRYNIKLGGKKVVVSEEGLAGIEVFYKLFRETALRDGISTHSIEYYSTLYNNALTYKNGENKINVYVARFEGDAIAAIITLFRGGTATYLYGASSNKNRNLMAPYALQWRAICDAKKAGCKVYDLFGIPPDDNPSHPMHGLYQFKTGFGGTIIHRPGSYDFPCNKFFYTLFRAAEKYRKKLRDAKKRKL
jgi:lipid II:glycine glycyltransferase (peptidoglycan interpeptide bridge formation enzyme)